MIVQTRETVAGTEYWDTTNQKVVFVPQGKQPTFDVTANPDSMLSSTEKTVAEPIVTFEDMTVKELKAYAAEHQIELPSDVTKKDDIIQMLSDVE